MPTIGGTPIDRARRWGFSVARYGAQQQTERSATLARAGPGVIFRTSFESADPAFSAFGPP